MTIVDDNTVPDEPQEDESVIDGTLMMDPVSEDSMTDGATVMVDVKPTFKRIGDYRVDRKLGEGGMGAVYRGIHTSTDQVVAIKVMNSVLASSPTTVERFHKEIRLLAEVNNPWVTNLLDSGEDDGVPYMVLEFVEGSDLREELDRRKRIPESAALDIIADVAKALIPAHERGIIHRDIKPANILLTRSDDDSDNEANRVRLADFGLARHIDQTESMQLTKTGAFMGTPRYMSPEQCRGNADLTPEADVYALGITIFELLTGRPPFDADDPIKLASMHCLDALPPIQQFEQSVTEATAALVSQALAKQPADRFADAAEFLEAIQQVRSGTIAEAAQHPALPNHEADSIIDVELEWRFDSSREELWPYISHTERVNEALGLDAVDYVMRRNSDGLVQRFGCVSFAGMKIEWLENPFEWVTESRFGVLREFTRGPFHWFSTIVTFEDLPEGGTLVKQRMRVLPRNIIGRLIAQLEVGVKAKRNLTRVYGRIDDMIARGRPNPFDDVWAPEKRLSNTRRRRLDERAALLMKEPADTKTSEALAQFVAVAPAQEVSRIRPRVLAERLQLDSDETIRACLYAAKHDLLKLQWDLICPTCRIPSDSRNVLSDIEEHAFCEACDVGFAVDLGESLELSFQAHPDIREVDQRTYCIGGPGHSPHVVAQIRLQSEENLSLRIQLSEGDYLIRGPQLSYNIPLRVSETAGALRADIPIDKSPPNGQLPLLKAGTQRLQIQNALPAATQIRIERTVTRQDLLTARSVATLPEFRQLFPLEVPAPGRLLSMANVSIVACNFLSLPQVSQQLGDVETCMRFAELSRKIRDRAATHKGTVIRQNDASVWSSFESEDNALSVIAFLLELDDETFGKPSIVLHRGPVVAISRDHTLHYFGQTVQACAAGMTCVDPGQLMIIDAAPSALHRLTEMVAPERLQQSSSAELMSVS